MKAQFLLSVALTIVAIGPLHAADIAAGKSLVQANCQNCHGNEVYTRADRRVQDMVGLKKQVQRCELSLGLSWFDDQIDNASAYLNDAYYRFK